MRWDIAAAGLVVGCVIGLTGMGGGALMTPVLVIFFHVTPSAAISSDILASVVLKPIGGGVHARRKTVNWRLVRWLSVGSVPAAFCGAYLIDRVASHGLENRVKEILGVVLLIAAAAMLVKVIVQARTPRIDDAPMDPRLVRPIPTLVIGAVGGVLVGPTSVGSGSLIIAMLMLLYPTLSSREMVGTDLVQAVPLVCAAALGHILFGHLQLDLTTSVLAGAIPGVYIGARVSARANDRYIKPLLVGVLIISSLKLLNASNVILLASTAGRGGRTHRLAFDQCPQRQPTNRERTRTQPVTPSAWPSTSPSCAVDVHPVVVLEDPAVARLHRAARGSCFRDRRNAKRCVRTKGTSRTSPSTQIGALPTRYSRTVFGRRARRSERSCRRTLMWRPNLGVACGKFPMARSTE
jgi:hypothetical protein